MSEQQTILIKHQENGSTHLNLLLFLWGGIFTFVCFYSSMTILPLYVFELGGTEFDTGLQTTLFYLASILMRFYFGPLTDRKGRKVPLMIGAFVFATSSILFLYCDSVLLVTLARIYHAVGLASFFSSGGSLIVDLAPSNRVGVYIGLYRMTYVLALLIGPSLALAVINSHNFQVWFVISFIIGLMSLLCIYFVKTPVQGIRETSGSFEKFKMVLKEKASYQVFFGIAMSALAFGALLTFVVLFTSQNTDIINPGLYFTYFSLVGILGNLGSGYLSDHFGRAEIVWPSIMLVGIGVGILYFIPWIPSVLWVSSITAGLGYSGAMAALAAWLVEVTDKDNRGTVVALQESVIDLSIGVASFIFGTVSGFAGMGGAFAFIGGIVLLLSIIKLLSFCSFWQAYHHK
ncbi:MAG: MFS transporter [Dehalobacterium sp.]